MSKYTHLMKLTSPYSIRMNNLRNRIFGDLTRPARRPSLKVISLFSEMPVHKNPEMTPDYYPRHPEINTLLSHLRDYGLFRDEHRDFQDEMRRLKALRGKRIWGTEKKPRKNKEA